MTVSTTEPPEPAAVPRSTIPGRQRWDVAIVLGRPHVARLIEDRLRESPDIATVRANPVTGRLLVLHDATLPGDRVARLVRDAITGTTGTNGTMPPAAASAAPSVEPPARPRRSGAGTSAVVAAGVAAVALTRRKGLPTGPLARIGAVGAVTVVVIRHAWKTSRRAEAGAPAGHPLLRIAGPHRPKLYRATALSALAHVADMSTYLLLGWTFLVVTTGTSTFLAGLGLTTATGQVVFLAAAAAVSAGLAALQAYFATMTWRDLAQAVRHDWRVSTYAHVQKVGLRHLEGERTTKLARMLTDDIDQLGNFFAGPADNIARIGLSLLVLLPGFLIFAPSVAWIVFLPVPLIIWWSVRHQRRTAPDYADSAARGVLLNSQVINSLEAGATVKSFVAEQHEITRIGGLSEDYRESRHRTDNRVTSYAQGVRAAVTASMCGIALAGGLSVLNGGLRFAVYNALTGLPFLLLGRLPEFGDAADQYQRTVAALRRVLELHELPVEPYDAGRPLAPADVTGKIVLDRVTFAYPGREPVLRELSLCINAGRTTGIVGVTGAGKTTIAKLLMRLEDLDTGRVLLDGRDIRDIRLADLRRAIGFVSQDAFLFDGTVLDNVRYGSFDADLDRVVAAARLTEADGFVQDMPHGYDTMVGERGAALSGGQKQRISLARAIVKDAPIVVLDEATSAVDNETEAAIQGALAGFARNRTLVIIAHRLSTVRNADVIYVMGRGGVVAECGTHDELLARNGIYASLWNLQVGGALA